MPDLIERAKAALEGATPGPWQVFGKMTGKVISQNAPGWVEICTAGDFDDTELIPYCADRWNADARLVALAPDLANALIVAEKVAAALEAAIIEHDTADYGPDQENPWVMQEWFSDKDREALAAFRAALQENSDV